jgi:hypothetical protein
MKRIYADFNTMMSTPVGLVKLGMPGEDELPPLMPSERVLFWEEGLEAEATIVEEADGYLLARPDAATYRHTPLPPEIEEELARERPDGGVKAS